MTKQKTIARLTLAASLSALLMTTACAGMEERLSRIGEPPKMSQISNPAASQYQPTTLPMPPQDVMNTSPNSLWQASRQTFFKDQRAHKVGDILTVMVEIEDEADWENKTERTRSSEENSGMPNLLGFETKLGKVFPGAVDPENLVSVNSDTESSGDGKIERNEDVSLKLAAMITQVLPNGNFIIRGQQEVRVNYELRELTLDGVIRPEDILNNNSISYEKIAEARISYGGRGQVSDIQQPRYGTQVLEALSPF